MMDEPNAASPFRRSLAVVVGINEYGQGVPSLRSAVNDARRVGDILAQQHGYEVVAVLDDAATKERLVRLLKEELPATITPDDRVLFYFAGHGVAIDGDQGPNGYLLPHDARRGDESTYLYMPLVHDALLALSCRHMLVILDSCFSGAFRWSGTRDLDRLPETIHQERYDRFIHDPAWQVITSAAQDQKALDQLSSGSLGIRDQGQEHSPFALALFEGLTGAGDVVPTGAGDGVITATELYLYMEGRLQEATIEAGLRQTPRLWPLSKHDKGEFIFLAPGRELNLPPAPPLSFDNNPWRGLASYEQSDEALFFGRDAAIASLFGHIEDHPFTVVLGASGTGKSSLLKAGVLSRLTRDERWCILPVVRPGNAPLESLARAVSAQVPATEATSDAIARAIAAWCAAHPSQKLVVVIDQCEELVTMSRHAEDRDAMLQLLANLLERHVGQVRVVLTLRTDFEPQFDRSALGTQWAAARYVVPPLTRNELREVIERPASARVLYFEPPDLVDTLLDDVVATPGGLPLLSFALAEMYVQYVTRQSADRALTRAEYDTLGGVLGALRSRADTEYEALDAAHRATMQRVMLRMVGGDSTNLARRRVSDAELRYPDDAENARVAAVLDRLVASRLVVRGKDAGGVYVEPAHDALVRAWARLIGWIQQPGGDEVPLVTRQKLGAAATEWSPTDRKSDALLWSDADRSAMLAPVVKRQAPWLNAKELSFARRSLRGRRLRRQVTIGVTVAIAALGVVSGLLGWRARQKGNEALLSARRVRSAVSMASMRAATSPMTQALLLAALVDDSLPEPSGGLDVVAPLGSRLVPQWTRSLGRGWDMAQVGGNVFSLESSLNVEWETNLGEGWYRTSRLADAVTSATLLPGEAFAFVAAYGTGALQLLDGTRRVRAGRAADRPCTWVTGEKEATLLPPRPGAKGAAVRAVAVSGDCTALVAGGDDGSIDVWKLGAQLNAPALTLTLQPGRVIGIAVSDDARRVTALSESGTLKVWDVSGSGATERATLVLPNAPMSVSMSADGRVVAVGDGVGRITVWRDGASLDTLQLRNDATSAPVDAIGVTPDGSGVVAVAGLQLTFWRSDGRGGPTIVSAPTDTSDDASMPTSRYPARLRFSSDGRSVFVAPARVQRFQQWSLVLPSLASRRWKTNVDVRQLRFSPDGTQLVADSGATETWRVDVDAHLGRRLEVREQTARLSAGGDTIWISSDTGSARAVALPGKTFAAAINPRGDVLAILQRKADDGAEVSLWSIAGTPTRLHTLENSMMWPPGDDADTDASQRWLRFSANGATLLAHVPGDMVRTTVEAWRVRDGVRLFSGGGIDVGCAAVSPDGTRVVTCALVINNANDFVPADAEVFALGDVMPLTVSQRLTGSGTTVDSMLTWAAFSPDGAHLALLGSGGRLQLWPAGGTGKALVMNPDSSSVRAAAFSPDGRLLAMALSDGTVAVEPIHWELASRALRERVVGCLTSDERVALLGELPDAASEVWRACERRFRRGLQRGTR